MSPQPLGVAVAGLGFGEKVHLPALAAATDLEAVALWHPRQERLDAATAAHGLKGFSDWDALLADPAVDAVIIATPPAPRFDLARRALEAGKHLLLEKPIALHADQARELQRLALARGLSVAVDYEYRAVPLFMQAARLLQAGAVGTPWLVKLDWLMGSRADPQRGWNWYAQADQGGGVIGALGTHAMDMLAWLIGPLGSRPGPEQRFDQATPSSRWWSGRRGCPRCVAAADRGPLAGKAGPAGAGAGQPQFRVAQRSRVLPGCGGVVGIAAAQQHQSEGLRAWL